MFILEKPYVSEFLTDTIVKNEWTVLDNSEIEDVDIEEDALCLIASDRAKKYYLSQEYPFIYGNSDISASWVKKNLSDSNLANYIEIFRNKIKFRELLKEKYPEFNFRALEV